MDTFICERPYAFFLLIPVIPIIIYMAVKTRNYKFPKKSDNKLLNRLNSFRKMIMMRTLFRCVAWSLLVCAFSKMYWGTYEAPVQKNGTAVSFVFDISNSMMAIDCPQSKTRLEASSIYARQLLSKIEENSSGAVSVVLAKGDGLLAVPLTEDYRMIESLLDSLSPNLMNAPGSSLGKGILKSAESFPTNYSAAGRIWLFTDGEETDNQLKTALFECGKQGIPVSIIGFGSEDESLILAGDNQTVVMSAQRKKNILATIEEVYSMLSGFTNHSDIIYVDSLEHGSAKQLLGQLGSENDQIITYETKPVPRYKLFLLGSILIFAFSFIFTEFDYFRFYNGTKKGAKAKAAAGLLVISGFFTGCSSYSVDVLKGNLAFRQKNYSHSVSCFKDVINSTKKTDPEVLNYALYNLGTSYMVMGEDTAAMDEYAKLPITAPDELQFSAYYNSGIIAYRRANYDVAADYFRKALEIESSSHNAKINLELSLQASQMEVQTENEIEENPVAEEKSPLQDMEKTVFQRIKDNEKNQWKNSDSDQTQSLADDY